MSEKRAELYRTPDGFLAIATRREGKKLHSQIEANLAHARGEQVKQAKEEPAKSSSLGSMSKEELLDYAESQGVDIKKSATKAEIIAAIEVASVESDEEELF